MIPPGAEYFKLACADCKLTKWLQGPHEWVEWAADHEWGIGDYVWDGENEIVYFCKRCSFGAGEKRRGCQAFALIRDILYKLDK